MFDYRLINYREKKYALVLFLETKINFFCTKSEPWLAVLKLYFQYECSHLSFNTYNFDYAQLQVKHLVIGN